MPKDTTQTARLYRMVMPDHLCPYGLKSKDLLERKGFEVEDHPLTTREETDAFMEKHGVVAVAFLPDSTSHRSLEHVVVDTIARKYLDQISYRQPYI